MLTAGVSLWLGLMTAQQSLMGSWGESASLHVVIACGTVLVVVGLAARRFLRAMLCALLVCIALVVLTITWAQGGADPNPTTWLLIGLVCSPGFIGLVASIALARWCGYRLLPGQSTGAAASRADASGRAAVPTSDLYHASSIWPRIWSARPVR